MSELPAVTGKEAIKAFEKIGFTVHRVKGSHYVLKKPSHMYLLTVPVHRSKPLKLGTLRNLIQAAGISVEEFITLLD